MGAEDVIDLIDLGVVSVPAAARAREFAFDYDPNPVHVTGTSNGLLPDGTVSGLLTTALLVTALMQSPLGADVLCASQMQVRWLAPVREADRLLVRAQVFAHLHQTSRRTVKLTGTVVSGEAAASGANPALEVMLEQVIR